MSEQTGFSVRIARWPQDQPLLRQVREKVFIEEQQVPAELEWDGTDDDALHLLALDERGRPVGTARLRPSGQIGRMAVLAPWRRRGVGSALLRRLLEEAAKGDWPDLFLNAQLSAVPFYTRHGFSAEGEVFYEAGIPHRGMTRSAPMADPQTPIGQSVLGDTPYLYQLHSVVETRELTLRMVGQASRSLDLLTVDLEPALYNQPAMLESFKGFALKSNVARIRILLQDNSLVRSQGHRLVELIQRLPSTVELRKPDRVFRDYPENFLLVDDCGYLHRRLSGRYQVSACCNDRLKVSQFEDLFTEAWEAGEPDRELARLHL